MDKENVPCMHKRLLSLKNEGNLSFVTTWTNWEDIMLSEESKA